MRPALHRRNRAVLADPHALGGQAASFICAHKEDDVGAGLQRIPLARRERDDGHLGRHDDALLAVLVLEDPGDFENASLPPDQGKDGPAPAPGEGLRALDIRTHSVRLGGKKACMTDRRIFYRYLLSGGVSTASHYLALYILVRAGITPVLGSTVGAIVGLVLNFTVCRRWVFGAPAKISSTLSRFLLVWMLALLINAWILDVLLAAGLYYLLAQVIATGILVVINFNLHRRWTFSSTKTVPTVLDRSGRKGDA